VLKETPDLIEATDLIFEKPANEQLEIPKNTRSSTAPFLNKEPILGGKFELELLMSTPLKMERSPSILSQL
jgi:hypothetical protein